jgi:hypothetical protein
VRADCFSSKGERYRRPLSRFPVSLTLFWLLPVGWMVADRLLRGSILSRKMVLGEALPWMGYGLFWFGSLTGSCLSVFMWRVMPPLADEPKVLGSPKRWLYAGSFLGILLGLLLTMFDQMAIGWAAFPYVAVGNLITFPLAGLGCAALVPWEIRARERKWPRFQIHVVMLFVAYLGILMGLTTTTTRLGAKARMYEQKFMAIEGLITVYNTMMEKDSRAAAGCQIMLGYYKPLIAKYDAARKRPWINVPPDPPLPGSTPAPVAITPDVSREG